MTNELSKTNNLSLEDRMKNGLKKYEGMTEQQKAGMHVASAIRSTQALKELEELKSNSINKDKLVLSEEDLNEEASRFRNGEYDF